MPNAIARYQALREEDGLSAGAAAAWIAWDLSSPLSNAFGFTSRDFVRAHATAQEVRDGAVDAASEAGRRADDLISLVRWFSIAVFAMAIAIIAALAIGTVILARKWFAEGVNMEALKMLITGPVGA